MTYPSIGAADRLVSGLHKLEGPAVDRDGNLWVVDMETFGVYRVSPDGRPVLFYKAPGLPNSSQWHACGNLYLAARGQRAITALSMNGRERIVVQGAPDQPLLGPNDLVFDHHGGIYFTDPHTSSAENPIGCVYYWSAQTGLRRMAGGLAYPNGLCLSADERALYLAITMTNQVLKLALNGPGSVRAIEPFCRIEGGLGPDGMKLDLEGHLWVAQWGTGCVFRVSPSGQVLGAVRTDGEQTTNLAFGGRDNRTLYITDMGTGTVYVWNSPVPGLPLYGQRAPV